MENEIRFPGIRNNINENTSDKMVDIMGLSNKKLYFKKHEERERSGVASITAATIASIGCLS
jgi:hypothetical protein